MRHCEDGSCHADLYQALLAREASLSVIGLGYVGLPLALHFARHLNVVGFDINEHKIALYKSGKDPTLEAGDEAVRESTVRFTSDEQELSQARFHIVAVPTPINQDKTPNLTPVIEASKLLGRNLKQGTIVVYESTVYPGVTEQVCVPILEKESGLSCGSDFKVGYSPERINPGDKVHTLETIVKVVSGMDEQTRDIISDLYRLVVKAGTYPVSSIMIAEAIKVLENSQRDVNIAFINEVSLILDRMGVDTGEVVDGMNTKWNALGFRPGLVGGHCIGVDPYYFLYEAEKLGVHSQIIAAARRINDGMGHFVADACIKQMILAGKTIKGSRVAILGLTFKENTPDVRNSRVVDIIRRLQEHAIQCVVTDAWADREEAHDASGLYLYDLDELHDVDAIIIAVGHREYKAMAIADFEPFYRQDGLQKVITDVKGVFKRADFEAAGYSYWTL